MKSKIRIGLDNLLFYVVMIFAVWFLVSLFAHKAHAQTVEQVQAKASLSWEPVTQGCMNGVCNVPLTGDAALKRYELFAGSKAITGAETPITIAPDAKTYAYTATVPNGSTLYFKLRACNDLCGALSDQVQKEVKVIVPGKPAGVAITITVQIIIQ